MKQGEIKINFHNYLNPSGINPLKRIKCVHFMLMFYILINVNIFYFNPNLNPRELNMLELNY